MSAVSIGPHLLALFADPQHLLVVRDDVQHAAPRAGPHAEGAAFPRLPAAPARGGPVGRPGGILQIAAARPELEAGPRRPAGRKGKLGRPVDSLIVGVLLEGA